MLLHLIHIGAFANNSEDIAAVLEVMSGWDACDSTSSKNAVPELSGNLSLNGKKLKLGFAKEYFGEGTFT